MQVQRDKEREQWKTFLGTSGKKKVKNVLEK